MVMWTSSEPDGMITDEYDSKCWLTKSTGTTLPHCHAAMNHEGVIDDSW